MTYQQILDKLSQLSPEQLQQEARYGGEDHAGDIYCLDILDEDYLGGDDGCERASSFDEEDRETFKVVYPKGTIIFLAD